MKSTIILSVITALIMSCNNHKIKNGLILGKSYGQVKVDTSKAISVKEMLTSFKNKTGRVEFTFKSDIAEICLNAGCWIDIDKGNGETFMVRFKEHFTIPTNTRIGSQAFLHGVAFLDTISVEFLKHFAEDAGKSKEEISKIIHPKYDFGFEADGITLVKD